MQYSTAGPHIALSFSRDLCFLYFRVQTFASPNPHVAFLALKASVVLSGRVVSENSRLGRVISLRMLDRLSTAIICRLCSLSAKCHLKINFPFLAKITV